MLLHCLHFKKKISIPFRVVKQKYITTIKAADIITFAAAPSERRWYCGARRPCVCVSAEPRLHAIGGEGNARCPVLPGYFRRLASGEGILWSSASVCVGVYVRLACRIAALVSAAKVMRCIQCPVFACCHGVF